jgi:acyl-CoA thioester hydrolase
MSEPPREPSAGWLEGREHCLPVRIYYEDTDFTGVVYHANYLRYFERGRSDFFRLVGISHSEFLALPEPTAFSVIRIELDFKRAARMVRPTYDSVTGARLNVSQRITRGDELIAQAAVTAVCIDLKGRAIRPPRQMFEKLSPLFAPATP